MAKKTSAKRAAARRRTSSRRVAADGARRSTTSTRVRRARSAARSAGGGTGTLRVRLVDVHGTPIGEPVTAGLRHMSRGTVTRVSLDGAATAEIAGLQAQPDGLYRLEADPPSYRPSGRFAQVREGRVTTLDLTFAIDPRKVQAVAWPTFAALPQDARDLLEHSTACASFVEKAGASLYDALDDIRRAGLLNIVAKARATVFANGRSVLSYVLALRELRGDRFFADVTQDLREETKNAALAGLFTSVNGSLHRPPDGFEAAGSFKTTDAFGNLQLTFFARGDSWVADIDIDDANGLAHIGQVVRNTVTGDPTHPYDIHQVLLHYQMLDPGYVLQV